MNAKLIASLFFPACFLSVIILSEIGSARREGLESPEGMLLGLPIRTPMTINRIDSWYDSRGDQENDGATGNAGLWYPAGTATAVFEAGLMWGGKFDDGQAPLLRVNGQSYNAGTQRGAILGIRTGIAEDPDAPDVRIWKIRNDYGTADLRRDASVYFHVAIGQVTTEQLDSIFTQYERDWLEWPAEKGAPFYDSDGDGFYSPMVVDGQPILYPNADEPGLAAADQVLWYVCNDIGVQQPWTNVECGIEQQTTIWGYARTDAVGDALFKRFRIIYKGIASSPADASIDSMYICQWSDPDLGTFADDFAGCDTILSLGFVYNGTPTDALYSQYGLAPPAVGYDLLQGPLVAGLFGHDLNRNGVDDASDYGVFDFRRIGPGMINMPLTAFIYFAAGGAYSDPPFSPDGGIQWYQMLRGLPPTPQGPPDPPPPTDPFTGQPAGHFWLYAGSDGYSPPDPDNPNGWVDGMIEGPGDRRLLLPTGPFTMAIGDTQEMMVATVGGSGTSYLTSVGLLKINDHVVQSFYDTLSGLITDVEPIGQTVPNSYAISQNYPNPFNPSTTIRFSIPASADVSLKIFNLLGEEVATLVSGHRDAGTHTVQWDAAGQPSGVYFYRLRAGSYVETRKLVLVR